MAFDYLKEIRELIVALRFENFSEIANLIQDAVDSASTSTELLMGVRFLLSQTLTQTPLPKNIKNRIENTIKEIEQILAR